MKKQIGSILLAIALLLALPQTVFFVRAAESPENTAWNTLYYDYIVQDKTDADHSDDWEYVTYELHFLDEDAIPELWITYQYSAAGCRLLTIAGGAVSQASLPSGYLSYNPYGNAFFHTGGRMDVYFDTVYRFDQGSLMTIGEGYSEVIRSGEGTPIRTEYYWNGSVVSEQEYLENRSDLVGDGPLQRTNFEESTPYSYDEILSYLSNLEIVTETEAAETEPPVTTPEETPSESTEAVTTATEQTEPFHKDSTEPPTTAPGNPHMWILVLGGLVLCSILLLILLIKRLRK